MFYIHDTVCISAQNTFGAIDLETLVDSVDNKLTAIEPKYNGLPANIARRMSKAVRMGTGAALVLLDEVKPDGIVIGTGNGGMEESGKFLDQIVQYDEDTLTPANFVQSTPNNTASQLSILTQNNNYNVTHVHLGLAFENAIVDVAMLLRELPENTYLLGAVDEIAAYSYNIDKLGGWYKKEAISTGQLYSTDTAGTIPGEIAAMFIVNNDPQHAKAKLQAIVQVHSDDVQTVKERIEMFLQEHMKWQAPDLILSGENGDNRLLKYYDACETLVPEDTTIARFKHMCGESPTAVSFAVWLGSMLLSGSITLPHHAIKRGIVKKYKSVLIYNNYKGFQHSFILMHIV